MPPTPSRAAAAIVAAALLAAIPAKADEAILGSSQDNTLYEVPDEFPQASNGAGSHMFAGQTALGLVRRALIAFDVAGSIPAGSTIDAVSLTLNMSRTMAGTKTVELHRVLTDWGEGASNAPGEEGGGGEPQAGDATWLHTFFDTELWSAEGGDIDGMASATQPVAGVGMYTWSGPDMVADVQQWLDDPSSNFGWALVGEEGGSFSAKRFDTRENDVAALRPQLVVTFTPAGGECGPEDINVDGVVDVLDLIAVILAWGPCPEGVTCPEDVNSDGAVDVLDLIAVILAWGAC